MTATFLRFVAVAVLVLVAGCHSNPACEKDAEYLQAVERPRIKLPGNLSASERMAPLVIPPVPTDAARLDPQPRCLDEPPGYFMRKSAPTTDSAEAAVKAWAVAWSERQAPAVMQMYSPAFQAPGTAGSAEFLDQRRAEIATGPAPAARIDDVQVTGQGADRRTVTFVQQFEGESVRKELVLVREGGNWRIISEQTLDSH
jgi:hypothetical protein